jgi:hypothetical protein
MTRRALKGGHSDEPAAGAAASDGGIGRGRWSHHALMCESHSVIKCDGLAAIAQMLGPVAVVGLLGMPTWLCESAATGLRLCWCALCRVMLCRVMLCAA